MKKLRSLTLMLSTLAIIGVALASSLILKQGGLFHLGREGSSGVALEGNISETPLFPSELKNVFLTLLPTEEEVKTEIRRFKEARGYEPEAIVVGVPPAIFSRDQIRQLLTEVEELWKKSYQMEVVWNIPEYTCLCYVDMLAEEIERFSVPTRVFYVIREKETEALDIINAFESKNISVWIKLAGRRSKFVRVPSSLDEKKLKFLLNASRALYEGKEVSEVISEGYGEGNWEKDKVYHGWICVFNQGFDNKWWFWRGCSTGIISGCRGRAPSELTACDIHYMREMYFFGEMGRTNGLINFPGCKPAENPEKCGGSCGSINTLWLGDCNLTFSKLPLDEKVYFIYASYIPTHTKKDPFPYSSYCGCFGKCPDPQVFVIDIKYVFSP